MLVPVPPLPCAGYVYDPLDSFSFYNFTSGGKYGARENVTLLECMIACHLADACESIGYNDALQQCYLKVREEQQQVLDRC